MVPQPCDLSDDLSDFQQFKIIADLFRVSSYYLGRTAGVNPQPDHLGPF